MTHRSPTAAAKPKLFDSAGYKLLLKGSLKDADPIGRAMHTMIVIAITLFYVGLGLTLAGSFLAALNPLWLVAMLGWGVFIAAGMGLVMLVAALNVWVRTWQYGVNYNRVGLVIVPIFTAAVISRNSGLVLGSTDALGRALYGTDGLYFTDGNQLVAFVITLFVQGLMWAALFALPVLAMSGLAANKRRLNEDPHKLTDAETGEGQAFFWHMVCGYGVTPVAVAAWLPFFAALF